MPKFEKSDGFNMKRGSKPVFKDLGSSSKNAKTGDSPLEKFDWGSAIKGATSGAAGGSMLGPFGGVLGGLAGGLIKGFSGPSKEEEMQARMQTAQLTEQEAKSKLAEYAVKDKEKGGGYSGFDSEQA